MGFFRYFEVWLLLLPQGWRRRSVRPNARPPRQVIAHQIDNHRPEHQHDGDPKPPIMMETHPGGSMARMHAGGSFLVPVVFALTHWIPSKLLSIAALYSPRRAARLQLAR